MTENTTWFPDGGAPRQPSQIQDLIGNYQLIRLIGRGGMGEVYLARHRRFENRLYAIKLIRQDISTHAAQQRFDREIQAMGGLIHPNLVYATDAGVDRGRMYLVMEYVEGQNLQELIDSHGAFQISQAAEIVRQICCGVAHAHHQGVVHRDIKPANVLLSKDREVKVLDLGIASLQSETVSRMTRGDSVMGTGAFLAPELWDSALHASPASDVYAIGCTAYCLLIGQPPFAEKDYPSLYRLASAHQHADPSPVHHQRPQIGEELSAVILQSIHKDPKRRFQNAQEFAERLQPYCEPLTGEDQLFADATLYEVVASPSSKAQPAGDRRWKIASAAALFLILIVGFAVWKTKVGNPSIETSDAIRADQGSREVESASVTPEPIASWYPQGSRPAPDSVLVTVTAAGRQQRLHSEILLQPDWPNQADDGDPIQSIPFVLIPQISADAMKSPRSFYIMKEKVSAELFRRFEAEFPEQVNTTAAERRHQVSSDRPRADDGPVVNVTANEAFRFAASVCGGKVPLPNQWDAAFGRWFKLEDAQQALSPFPYRPDDDSGNDNPWGCREMAVNGKEFTRSHADYLFSTQPELVELRGRSIAEVQELGPLNLDQWRAKSSEQTDFNIFGERDLDSFSSEISFRVVLEQFD